MIINKNARTRYQALDRCLSDPSRKYLLEDLIKACDVALKDIDPDNAAKKRTVQYDLRYMESAEGWNAPVGRFFDGRRTYYKYSDENFSIEKQPLHQVEIEEIRSVIELLQRYQGIPEFKWINELTPKLEQVILDQRTEPLISIKSNNDIKGTEYLGPLFYHILDKQPIHITYQSFINKSPEKLIVHPYYLKHYNNQWFLFGLDHKLQKITHLDLGRFLEIKQEKISFVPNTTCNFDEYFEDIIGITQIDQSAPEKVVLRFGERAIPSVLSNPLHRSQKVVSNDKKGLVISIEVVPNHELENLILSFGELCTVLEPKDLRNKILERHTATISNYKL